MNLRKFLIMAILLAAGGMYAWRSHLDERSAPPDAAAGERMLGDAQAADIRGVSVVHAGGSYALERSADNPEEWALKRPEGARADPAKMREIMNTVVGLRSRNRIDRAEVEGDQSIYGLQPPELALTVSGTFGTRVFSFGKKVELSGRRYLQPENDGRLFLVDDSAFQSLRIAAEDVRDRKPIRFDAAQVSELAVVRGPEDILRFSKDGGKWRLEHMHASFEPDAKLVESKLRSLQNVRVSRFVDEPGDSLALYGLTSPRLIASLSFAPAKADSGAEAPRMLVQFGEGVTVAPGAAGDPGGEASLNPGKGYYFKIGGVPFVYESDRAVYGDFLQPPEFFRRREPWKDISPQQIERVEIEGSGKKLALRRTGGGWTAAVSGKDGDREAAADTAAVEGWIAAALNVNVLSYQAIAEAGKPEMGLREPGRTVRIFLQDRALPLLIVLGNRLKSMQSSEGEEGESPQFAAITHLDGAYVPAVLDAAVARHFDPEPDTFQPRS